MNSSTFFDTCLSGKVYQKYMKTNKPFVARKNRLSCELMVSLSDWKLPSSKLWPLATLTCLETFFLQHVEKKNRLNTPDTVSWSFTILIVGKTRMQKLNSQHRNKNYPTDVLSFPSLDWKQRKLLSQMAQLADYSLGDIVICKDVLEKQAKQFKLSAMDEYLHLLVHGFLHLLGYDHEISQKQAKIMERHEKTILEDISRTRSNSKAK